MILLKRKIKILAIGPFRLHGRGGDEPLKKVLPLVRSRGKAAKHNITLQVSHVQIGQVVVQSIRQGQIKALSQPRTATNIINVISQEQMERFPDESTADVLKRIPGVYIQNSPGEDRFALISYWDVSVQ